MGSVRAIWRAADHPRGPDGRFVSTGGSARRAILADLHGGHLDAETAADRLDALARQHEKAGTGHGVTARHLFALAGQHRPAGPTRRALPAGVTVAEHSSGRLHVQSPYDKRFVTEVKAMGGTWLPKSKSWSVPGDKAGKLDDLIHRTYGNTPSVTPPEGRVAARITTRADGRISVESPYNPAFVADARAAGGTWDAQSKTWVFPAHREQQARALAAKHYGRDWIARQERAERDRKEARAADAAAAAADARRRGAGPAGSRQKELIRRLTAGYDEVDWHDLTDSAFPIGSPRNPAPFLDSLTVDQASALIDDLLASGRNRR